MKKIAVLIMVAGLLIFVLTAFDLVTTNKLISVGSFEMTEKKDGFDWSPLIGAVILAIGGGLYFFGSNKR